MGNTIRCKKCGSTKIELHESVVGTQKYDVDSETGVITPTEFEIHNAAYEFALCKECGDTDMNVDAKYSEEDSAYKLIMPEDDATE